MDLLRHHEGMLGYILIAVIVAFLPLAYLAGADSRVDEISWRRRYHG
jgi:hypothetical protein